MEDFKYNFPAHELSIEHVDQEAIETVAEEVEETLRAFMTWKSSPQNSSNFLDLVEETMDIIHAAETLLRREMQYVHYDVQGSLNYYRNKIVEKNDRRGYYIKD